MLTKSPTKAETDQMIRALEHWLDGTPLDEQYMISAVQTVVHLAKLYIAGLRPAKE